jgi:hypothetical protein
LPGNEARREALRPSGPAAPGADDSDEDSAFPDEGSEKEDEGEEEEEEEDSDDDEEERPGTRKRRRTSKQKAPQSAMEGDEDQDQDDDGGGGADNEEESEKTVEELEVDQIWEVNREAEREHQARIAWNKEQLVIIQARIPIAPPTPKPRKVRKKKDGPAEPTPKSQHQVGTGASDAAEGGEGRAERGQDGAAAAPPVADNEGPGDAAVSGEDMITVPQTRTDRDSPTPARSSTRRTSTLRGASVMLVLGVPSVMCGASGMLVPCPTDAPTWFVDR